MSNDHYHNTTLGEPRLFDSAICQICSNYCNWAIDKSLKENYSTRHPLCVEQPTPVTALNVHLCVCERELDGRESV